MREQTGGVIRVHIHRAENKTRHSWEQPGSQMAHKAV